MTDRIGIFGGTFDPPHIGHQILAAEALDQLALEMVLWVLTPDPPHKRGNSISPLLNRLEMVEAAIEDCPNFVLSRVDVDRPAPHYAVDTLRLLSERYPGSELIYLMGGDSLDDLPHWYAYKDFVAACTALGVMRRPGDQIDLTQLEFQVPGIEAKIQFIETPILDISASKIRHKARSGGSYRYYLPPPVYRIIQKHDLYRVQNSIPDHFAGSE